MDYDVWVYSWIPDIKYGIKAFRQVLAIYILEPRFQKPGVKTIEWALMSQIRVNMGFGKVIQHKLGLS